jgi:putative membrane protein
MFLSRNVLETFTMEQVIACLIMAAPVIAVSADESPDPSFFKQAAEGGIAEVDAGTLAQSKGNSQAVKDFGAMMVKDHSAANEKLKSVATAENVSTW